MENFTFTFSLNSEENSGSPPDSTSYRKKDFKATSLTKTREEKQEERRRRILEEQRQKRNSLVNQARKLVELSIQNENAESDDSDSDFEIPNHQNQNQSQNQNNNLNDYSNGVTENQQEEVMDIDIKKKKNRKNKNKNKNKNKSKNKKLNEVNKFKNQLMLSEKLEEIPEDFETNWIAVKIPNNGIPCLVISYNGKTVSRNVDGTILETFYSNIPGGNPLSREYQNYSILDCIYDEEASVYYIKDIMCWKGYPTYDCEAEFRFFWIQTKVNEIDLRTRGRYHSHAFIPLPTSYCQPQALTTFLNRQEEEEEMGHTTSPPGLIGPVQPSPPTTILFYNKESHYILGVNPLCCHLTLPEAKTFLQPYCSSMEL